MSLQEGLTLMGKRYTSVLAMVKDLSSKRFAKSLEKQLKKDEPRNRRLAASLLQRISKQKVTPPCPSKKA